jgi:CheY-like chemotaxis protein
VTWNAAQSRLAHDLKTPIAVIVGYAELLAVRTDEALRLEASGRIIEAARQLEAAVNRLADSLSADVHRAAERTRVLVVDDDALLRDLIIATLSGEEFEVDVAPDAAAAVAALASAPSVVVLDWRLPDASGAMVLAEIKRRTPDLPVVVLTADAQPDQRERARQLGADAFLTKPFSPLELLATVERLLNADPGLLQA